jgi:hypothetical protein
MEIVKNAISVKLDQDEKTCLQGAMEIIRDIKNNQDIIDGCDALCPFSNYCNKSQGRFDNHCLLNNGYYTLKIILEKCK